MKSRPVKSRRNLPILAASIAVLLSAMPDRAQAAALTWDGDQDGNWNTDNSGNTNWGNAGSILPVNGDTLTFTGTSNTSTTNNITGLTIGTGSGTAITLTNTAPSTAFTLAGNSITLAGNIVTTTSGGPAAATHTISLDMILNGNRLITAVTDSNLTVSGVISNDGTNRDLNKEGAGILTLSGNNSYGGNTTVGNAATGGGTLVLGHNNALGGSGTLTVTGTGTIVELQNGITISNNVTYANGGNNKVLRGAASAVAEYAGAITVSESGAGNFDISGGSGGTLTISGAITSTAGAGVSITGGTVVLSNGSNAITGTTDITSGTLRVAHASALGASTVQLSGTTTVLELANGLTVANNLTVADANNGKTLRLLNGATSAEYSGAITIAETTAGNFDLNANGGTLTLSGQITGSGGAGMQTAGTAGTIILSNNTNDYTGVTDLALTGSILRATAANALGATGVGNETTVASGAALQLQGGITYAAELLNLNGTGISTSGALRNMSGNNTWTGNITLNGTTEIQTDDGSLVIDVASGDAITGTNRNLTIETLGTSSVTISDVISTGTGTFSKAGPGDLTLSAPNTFSGQAFLNNGVTIVNSLQDAGTASSLGTGGTTSTIRFGNTGNTGTLRYLGTSAASTNRQVVIGNGGNGGGTIENDSVSSSHTLTFSNAAFNSPTAAVTQARTLTLGGSNTGANTISGVIANNDTGTGGLIALTKAGIGTWELGGVAHTYTGATAVNAGTLNLLSGGSLASTALTIGVAGTSSGTFNVRSGASLATTTTPNIRQGVLNLENTTQTLGTITLGNASASGTASLTLSGGTTVTQSADLTYTANSGGHQGIISGGTIDLMTAATTRTWTVNDTAGLGVDLAVSSNLTITAGSGTRVWLINGGGTAELTGTGNTLGSALTTRLQGGTTLRVASGSSISTGPADIRYGTLEMNNSQTLGAITLGQVTQGNGNSALVIGSGQTITAGGGITYTADDNTANLGSISGGTFQFNANRTFDIADNTLVSGPEVEVSSALTETGGARLLTKQGGGMLRLSSTLNSYTGGTTISAGTLQLGASGVIPDTGTVGVGGTAENGTLDLNGFSETIAALTLGSNSSTLANLTHSVVNNGGGSPVLTLGGTLTYQAGASGFENGQATISANLGLGSANRTFTINNSPNAAVDLLISGEVSGTVILTKNGAGTLRLTGTNTYDAQTRIDNGTVEVTTLKNEGTASSLGSGTNIGTSDIIRLGTASNTGTLSYIGTGDSTDRRIQVGSDTTAASTGGATVLNNGSGALTFTNATFNSPVASGAGTDGTNTARTLTLGGSNTGANTIQGVIADNTGTETPVVNLVKQDAGHWTLSGDNTYTGTTTISGGTLEAAAKDALGGTSGLTVNTGGTLLLSNTGTTDRINDSATMTLAGGTIAFSGNVTEGSSPGTGALTLTASSVIDFLGGNAIINFDDSSSASWGAFTLSIWNWGGSYAGGGSDQLKFGTGSSALTSGQLGQISFYSDNGSTFLGTGGFVGSLGEVVPVPEPTSVCVALGLFGLAARRELGRSARRRRAIVAGI